MTARITRAPVPGVTTEDAFGTPPAARGSMMNVAGKVDADEDRPLLVDDDADDGDEFLEGARSVRMTLGDVRRLVRRLTHC